MTLENKHGDTALEVAKNWGDDFIYAIVYAKVASLPPPVGKKGESRGSSEMGGDGYKAAETLVYGLFICLSSHLW